MLSLAWKPKTRLFSCESAAATIDLLGDGFGAGLEGAVRLSGRLYDNS